MREAQQHHPVLPRLQAILAGAMSFGLSDDEVWLIVDESMRTVGGDATVAEYLEELSGALALGILAKQRRVPDRSDTPGTGGD
jgi:hypothetical protein